MSTKRLKYIKEYNSFNIDIGDDVIIHYWYNNMITPVKIMEKKGQKYLVSHNVESSKIMNAPDEWVKKSAVIDHHHK